VIIDGQTEVICLLTQKAGVFDIPVAGSRATGWMIMRKENPARIEAKGSSEKFPGGHKHIPARAFSNNFFGNDMASCISENRQHAFLIKVLHCREQVGGQCALVVAEPCSHELLAQTIMHKLADRNEGPNPAFTLLSGLAKLDLGCLANSGNRAEPVQEPRSKILGLFMQGTKKLAQMPLAITLDRRW
jgi:hypothetical protein